MNPSFFRCFSWFSNFSNFRWFSSDLNMKFDSVAWFPARGSFQIARSWNIKPIQIFVFIWCSCAVRTSNSTASKNGPQTTAPESEAALISQLPGKIAPLSIEFSDFTHCSFYGRNFWICPLIFDMPTSCPATPYYSSSLYILGIYALRVTPI